MDFIHLWHDDRALSKILRTTIPIPVHGLKVKVTDFEFSAKPLIDLNHVWYEWIEDSKMIHKEKAQLQASFPVQ